MGEGEQTEIVNAESRRPPLVVRPEPTKPNLWNRGILLPAGIGAVAVFCMINYLLAIAGLWTGWRLFTVAVIAEGARGQVVAAAVALISGFIALITFTVNYHQKNYIQEKANFTAEQIADDNRRQQNKWEEDRLRTQQVHFDRQRAQERAQAEYDSIAKEYDALSKDFVADQELARINAAIGLAAIAMRPDPRRLVEESLKPEDAPKTRDYYPWYERVASQLAAALITYERPSERAQVRNSIRVIAEIDKEVGQPLLHFLIHQIADANRTAYRRLVETFAEGMACENPLHLRTFARAMNVFSEPLTNARCLIGLMASEEYLLAYRAQRDLRRMRKYSTPGDPDAKYMKRLRRVCGQLVDTRDAIRDCVRPGVRNGLGELIESESEVQKLGNIPELKLDRVFLQGANLSRAHLQKVSLNWAQLQNARLSMAQLDKASLHGAQLQEANLIGAELAEADLQRSRLQRANLHHAKLQRAKLSMAQMQSSNLFHAQLHFATLVGAELQGARLNMSQLQGAILEETQLQGARFDNAQLQGTRMSSLGGLDGDNPPTFDQSNVWEADFNVWRWDNAAGAKVKTAEVEMKTRDWFKERYPGPWPEDG